MISRNLPCLLSTGVGFSTSSRSCIALNKKSYPQNVGMSNLQTVYCRKDTYIFPICGVIFDNSSRSSSLKRSPISVDFYDYDWIWMRTLVLRKDVPTIVEIGDWSFKLWYNITKQQPQALPSLNSFLPRCGGQSFFVFYGVIVIADRCRVYPGTISLFNTPHMTRRS